MSIAERNAENARRAERSAKAFSGQQNNKDTCALMSVLSVLKEVNGDAPPEGFSVDPSMLKDHVPSVSEILHAALGTKDMIDIGKASGGYTPCNGTTDVS